MAKCSCCGKGVTFGIKVSHSHRRSNRTWNPNVKRVKAVVDGSPKYIYACTAACALVKLPARSDWKEKMPVTSCDRLFLFFMEFLGGKPMLPHDPIMLLSYVNTQLRDRDASLDAFCDREQADRQALCAALAEIGYEYSREQNRFV